MIPSDHKWFRNLAISQIIVETMEDIGIEFPEPTVEYRRHPQKISQGGHLTDCVSECYTAEKVDASLSQNDLDSVSCAVIDNGICGSPGGSALLSRVMLETLRPVSSGFFTAISNGRNGTGNVISKPGIDGQRRF